MIKVDRQKIDKPEFFYSKEYDRLQQEISDFYGMRKNSRSQRTFTVGYLPDQIIDPLAKLFEYKCAFCESTLMAKKPGYESYLHRFRPDSYSQGFDSKEIAPDHYWWLTYEWENLYMCCHSCSRFKSNMFPVDGKRAAIQTPHEEIATKEKALLIDPCADDPNHYFAFDISTCEITPIKDALSVLFSSQIDPSVLFNSEYNKQKAKATIEIFGLNRQDLIEERKIVRVKLSDQFNKISKSPKEFYNIIVEWKEIINDDSSTNHSLFRKTIIHNYLNDKKSQNRLGSVMSEFESYISPNLEDITQQDSFLNIKQEAPQESIKGGFDFDDSFPMSAGNIAPLEEVFIEEEDIFDGILKNVYLDRIILKNFKCFSELTLKLPDYSDDTSSEPWLVFLGENGVGKSSVLKAIALALMGQKYLDTLNIEVSDLLKYGKQKGFIQVYGKGKDEFYEITYNKKENKIVSNIHHPAAFLIGYGSTRLLPVGNLDWERGHPNYIKVKNLFDPSVSLSDAKDWFLNTDRKTFNEVSRSLKNLLLLEDKDSIQRSIANKQIFIKYDQTGDTINIDHLSDGYKTVFAIAIDMIRTLSEENIVYGLAEGIVLVDEVGTHLHPRWKMEVIERLRGTFPKIQFIITTHEPLCLRGIKANEVVVLRKNEENNIEVLSDLPDPSSLRIDQLLTSQYFGLNSTMDIHTERLFKEYYELLSIDESNRTEKQIASIKSLKKQIDDKNYMRFGNDIREELIYQVVDEMMAKGMRKKDLKIETENIKEETITQVQDLWDEIDINE
ncbi:AAA family ATPase [Kordia jejudonensis]|uniref:AAA family ATPase n=1 Tax=Kordia jejudonensis TaxID=1348245 RepID=UPI0006298FE2|nr:AAA family ATPase [Kordia jejudonensis]